MGLTTGIEAEVLLLGRILFGGLLALQGAKNLTHINVLKGKTRSKGVPAPRFAVILASLTIIAGGLGIVLGVYPAVSALLIAIFFAIVTPIMHNFWAVPEDIREDKLNAFLENIELLGAALIFLVLGSDPWSYALNIGI